MNGKFSYATKKVKFKLTDMHFLGNQNIIDQSKIGFLSSQKCSADVILKSYDWAKQMRKDGKCVITGNHSQIEKDVFEILLKGKQPIILALARGLHKQFDESIQKAIDSGRLLIITPFDESFVRVTRETALVRNKLIVDLADEMVVGYVSDGGQLDTILKDIEYSRVK